MRRRSIASLCLLLAYLPACTSWQVTTTPLPELAASPSTSPDLRVTTASGGRFELLSARVIEDSLVGVIPYPGSGRRAVAVPDITKVEVQKPNASRTAAVILLPMLVLGMVAEMNAISNW